MPRSLQGSLLLVVLCLFFHAGNTWPQEVTDSACGGAQSVYYGNGVLEVINAKHTMDSLEDLKDLLRNRMISEEFKATKFGIALNRSVSPISDVIEAAGQILGNEYPSLLIGHLLGISHLTRFFIPAPLQQQLNDVLRNEAVRRLIQTGTSGEGEPDVREQVENYSADIGEGRKIVVVAHSQGNIFVNLAFGKLNSNEQNSFAMVPVASPESIAQPVLAPPDHRTFSNDVVIEGVRVGRAAAGLPDALPANDFLENPQTFLRHQFPQNYLTDDSAREFILNGVITSLAGLPSPPIVGEPGIITVTLTWGQQPDVDLHVFEPDGTHVYYAKLQGSIGFLDVDDINGEGPEHYFVSCSNLLQSSAGLGVYRVGVNYFRGLAPETASITVQAPGVNRTFNVGLPTALGPSGDATPVPVANIVVTESSQTGLLQFDVIAP